MRRPRRSSSTGVDLIGFLDILSAVMVIVLLVISVLALSIGVQGSVPGPLKPEGTPEPAPVEAPERRPAPAQVEIRTVDGQNVTAATAFLLCKGGQVEQFEPGSGQRIRSWSLETTNPVALAQELAAPNVYLAVSGSCFPSLDALVVAFRTSGSQLGYEPTSEEAVLPWQ